ncbi:carboxymuconolactone decarboxylase family protein [Lysobacter arenosi]|jgi:AhpD family alkylhydroperoxidase|uniref:Carboxymuconolactone decarboxylase family protein n=1 Tax=Lysobacter arenosi TaxID=2795387 RepID=A0ABX7RCF7_9GAMM|nr:carboxymuconolactone decarboxylase family protein [Lysobacter arenosi]QSX75834.1 carboxymuconolactone decarboxylase family protein [Lysobacter arenosi]
MQPRLDFYKASPDAAKAMLALEAAVNKLGLEPALLELVKLRSSQLNGCAYCVDLHSSDARKRGESERRLHAVAVWRESPFFSDRERAALAWTESLTLLSQTRAPDADYEWLGSQFDERERVNLTVAINAINGWNRLAVGFRSVSAT